MRMTVSVNNENGVPYLQYGTDKQKARAAKFAKADNRELTELANKINHRQYKENKTSKNLAKTVAALPLITAAAAAITTKGKVSTKTLAAAKSAVMVGGAMALIGGVFNANQKIVSKNPKVANTEKKHPILSLAGLSAVAAGVVTGAEALVKTISPKAAEKLTKVAKKVKLDKVAEKMDKAPEAVRKMASNIAEKISLPKGVKEKLSSIASKVKMPQILKDGYSKVANAEMTGKVVKAAKNAGKWALKNPIGATIVAIGTVAFASSIKRAVETSQTKAKLKEAQLKTANNLIDAYAAENDSLKTANSKAAQALEESNTIVAEDAEKTEAEEE